MLQALGSRLQALGSRLQALGSRLQAPGMVATLFRVTRIACATGEVDVQKTKVIQQGQPRSFIGRFQNDKRSYETRFGLGPHYSDYFTFGLGRSWIGLPPQISSFGSSVWSFALTIETRQCQYCIGLRRTRQMARGSLWWSHARSETFH